MEPNVDDLISKVIKSGWKMDELEVRIGVMELDLKQQINDVLKECMEHQKVINCQIDVINDKIKLFDDARHSIKESNKAMDDLRRVVTTMLDKKKTDIELNMATFGKCPSPRPSPRHSECGSSMGKSRSRRGNVINITQSGNRKK